MKKVLIVLQTFPANHSKQLSLHNHHQDILEDSILVLEQEKQAAQSSKNAFREIVKIMQTLTKHTNSPPFSQQVNLYKQDIILKMNISL